MKYSSVLFLCLALALSACTKSEGGATKLVPLSAADEGALKDQVLGGGGDPADTSDPTVNVAPGTPAQRNLADEDTTRSTPSAATPAPRAYQDGAVEPEPAPAQQAPRQAKGSSAPYKGARVSLDALTVKAAWAVRFGAFGEEQRARDLAASEKLAGKCVVVKVHTTLQQKLYIVLWNNPNGMPETKTQATADFERSGISGVNRGYVNLLKDYTDMEVLE